MWKEMHRIKNVKTDDHISLGILVFGMTAVEVDSWRIQYTIIHLCHSKNYLLIRVKICLANST